MSNVIFALCALVFVSMTTQITKAEKTAGPRSSVSWDTVRDDCPQQCGNYTGDLLKRPSCRFYTKCDMSFSRTYCQLGSCPVSEGNPLYINGAVCPQSCRVYRRDTYFSLNDCEGSYKGKCEEVSAVYAPLYCDLASCPACPGFNYTDNITKDTFFIKRTPVGGEVNTDEECNVDREPMGKVTCLEDGVAGAKWGEFRFNQQCNFSGLPDSPVSDVLRKLSQDETATVDVVLQTVVNVTHANSLTALDLVFIAAVFEKTQDVKSINYSMADNILEIYSDVLESPEEDVTSAQYKGNAGNRILKVVDTLPDKLVLTSEGQARIVENTLGMMVWDLKKQPNAKLPIGLQLEKTSNKGQQTLNDSLETIFEKEDVGETQVSIKFSEEALQSIVNAGVDGAEIRLSMTVYTDPRLFAVEQKLSAKPTKVLNSMVIAAKLTVGGKPITNISVIMKFLPVKKLPPKQREKRTVCAYWDFTGNDNKGSWSTDGCRYVGVEEGLDVCDCQHLTNFAVLFAWDSNPVDHSMTVISITGLSLSISGLSVTALTFIIFRKFRETEAQKTLFNLALAELCAWIVFLTGFNQTQNPVGCITAAALLHYFILASFMWMLAEAVLHYRLFVKVLGTYTSRYMLKTGIAAWGVPLIPVMAVMITDVNLYMREDTYCWLSLTAFYYAFALPVGLIILCNIVLYILVVVSICKKPGMAVSERARKERAHLNIRMSFLIFVLFGLSWIFGFLAVADAKLVFQYLFCITSSTQGFFIFLFFTVLNKHARESWLGVCRRKREEPSERAIAPGIQPMTRKTILPESKSQRKSADSSL